MRLSVLAATVAVGLISPPAFAQGTDPNLGRNLAATCANCHGTNGNARGDMRPLAGVPAARLIAQWNDFKAGVGAPTIMHQIAKGYTDAQIQAIAAYLAAQKPAGK
jgi:cytochrome c553